MPPEPVSAPWLLFPAPLPSASHPPKKPSLPRTGAVPTRTKSSPSPAPPRARPPSSLGGSTARAKFLLPLIQTDRLLPVAYILPLSAPSGRPAVDSSSVSVRPDGKKPDYLDLRTLVCRSRPWIAPELVKCKHRTPIPTCECFFKRARRSLIGHCVVMSAQE